MSYYLRGGARSLSVPRFCVVYIRPLIKPPPPPSVLGTIPTIKRLHFVVSINHGLACSAPLPH